MPRSYATPLAFKTAVEQRLRSETAASGMDLQRRRQLFVFDRFLARLFHVLEDAVVLKGGLVIELRLERARTTKDIDLRAPGDSPGADVGPRAAAHVGARLRTDRLERRAQVAHAGGCHRGRSGLP